jgi:uncharacterized protein (DUF1015 family)
MADIFPFRGIRYNLDKVGDLANVVTPPYDVISEKERDMYYERHPKNVIRLDKGRPSPEDDEEDNVYTRAAAYFAEWLDERVLVKDASRRFYLTSVSFTVDEQPVTRYGLIARVRLEPFEKGIILPHEETYSKIKSERLELMKACHANFSHIFSVYTDKANLIETLKEAAAGKAPENEFRDDHGHHHRMWCIDEPGLQDTISQALKDRRLFIADGHHRYETALTYRDWTAERTPGFGPEHPANFIMMYLCSIADEGLTILPTHRLLTRVTGSERNSFLRRVDPFFEVESFSFEGEGGDAKREKERMLARMQKKTGSQTIAAYIKGNRAFHVLTLKPGVMKEKFGDDIAEPLRELDVTVLTRIILCELLGYGQAELDDETLINYTSSAHEAVAAVDNGGYEMAFILNPPSNEQVRSIAEAGYTMPRKTTFYYPKAITGQVMNSLVED